MPPAPATNQPTDQHSRIAKDRVFLLSSAALILKIGGGGALEERFAFWIGNFENVGKACDLWIWED